jgi:hypothetical protein
MFGFESLTSPLNGVPAIKTAAVRARRTSARTPGFHGPSAVC